MCSNNRTASLIFGSLFLALRLIALTALLILGKGSYPTYIIVLLCGLAIYALFDIGLIFGAYKEKTRGKRPYLNFPLLLRKFVFLHFDSFSLDLDCDCWPQCWWKHVANSDKFDGWFDSHCCLGCCSFDLDCHCNFLCDQTC